jgi:hypothetical protein
MLIAVQTSCCGWSSISTVFDPSGGVTNEQKKQKNHMTVSANAAISLMGFDPF